MTHEEPTAAPIDLVVRLEHGPGGSCKAVAKWEGRTVEAPLSLGDEVIEEALASIRRAATAPTREVTVSHEAAGHVHGAARLIGATLFRALFPEVMREIYGQSRQAADQAGKPWRLVLEIAVDRLARTPWELLYDPDRRQSLACADSVVRRPAVNGRRVSRARASKLRVSWVAASPRGHVPLQIEQERAMLDEALSAVPAASRPEVDALVPAVPAALFERLRRRGADADLSSREAHVLHLACHGQLSGHEGEIVLSTPGGDAHPIAASVLATGLLRDPSLRLVVINACHGAAATTTDALAGIAALLSRQGVPAVIGMQTPILDDFAVFLTRYFYEALARGARIDDALRDARSALQVHDPAWLEQGPWAAPALWLSGEGAEWLMAAPTVNAPAPDVAGGRVVTPAPGGPISKLKQSTRQQMSHLARLATVRRPGAQLKIVRPVMDEIEAMASSGHLVITGAPGAGKSGCLHDLVRRKLDGGRDVVLLTVDRLRMDDETELARGLGLPTDGSIAETLESWQGDGPAFLVVDALDAARSELDMRVLYGMLEEVQERAPRWHIIASMREFDLQRSRLARDIFAGAPHSTRSDSRFARIRHIVVGGLEDDELAQVRSAAPDLEELLRSGTRQLEDLVRNPFNLRLLCELIDSQTDRRRLTAVHTQIGLLDLYWTRRVTDEDRDALRLALLEKTVDIMVQRRSLSASKVSVIEAFPAAASALDPLLSDGVLSPSDWSTPGLHDEISFSHNVLYDYAVSRLWVRRVADAVIETLDRQENQDLLLAIRPSIVMVFQELWHLDATRQQFWDRSLAFEAAPNMRRIGKIIPCVVAAENYLRFDDIAGLVSQIGRSDGDRVRALIHHVIIAARTQNEGDPARHPLSGPAAPEWLRLARELSVAALEKLAGQIYQLIFPVADKKSVVTPEEMRHAGEAARRLLPHGLERSRPLARRAIGVISRTAESAPEESVHALARCLEPGELQEHGHEQLWSMAQHLDVLVRASPPFALRVVESIFGTRMSRDEHVPLGNNRIHGFTMSKSDMLGNAAYATLELLPDILSSAPETAMRMVVLIVDAARRDDPPYATADEIIHDFPFLGGTARLQEDRSHIWTAGHHTEHENWNKALGALRAYLHALASSSASASRLQEVLRILRDVNELAIVWKTVLDAARTMPATLGVAVVDLLCSTAILSTFDTRVAAGELLGAVYPHLTTEQRERIEVAVLGIPGEGAAEGKDYRRRCRDRLLGCIPLDLFATQDARRERERLDATGGPPPNAPDFSIGMAEILEEDESWRWRGVPIDEPQNRRIRDLTKEIRDGKPTSGEDAGFSHEEIAPIVARLHELDDLIRGTEQAGVHPDLSRNAHDHMVECCARLAKSAAFTTNTDAWAYVRNRLLAASNDPVPEHDPRQDASWDSQSPAWGSPQPRIDAARGLVDLMPKQSGDQELIDAVRRLASDPVPAVRFQIIANLGVLWRVARDLFWQLFWQVSRTEPRMGILRFFTNGVLLNMSRSERGAAARAIRIVHRRTRRSPHGEPLRSAYAFHVLRYVLWDDDPLAWRDLRSFLAFPRVFSAELSNLIHLCRELLVMDKGDDTGLNGARARALGFGILQWAVCSLQHELTELHTVHGPDYGSWPKLEIERLQRGHRMLESVADQVYFACGAHKSRSGRKGKPDASEPTLTAPQLRRFVEEAGPLLDMLCRIEHVRVAHRLLETLQFLSRVDPAGMFERVYRSVQVARKDGIQYESMTADLIVGIVEEYLADHPRLLKHDRAARDRILDILDLFVEAGWPRAARLTYGLEEVLR